MMAANYRHIGGDENRLGRHYSRFSGFGPRPSLPINHLFCENRQTAGRIGQDGLGHTSRSTEPRLRLSRYLFFEVPSPAGTLVGVSKPLNEGRNGTALVPST